MHASIHPFILHVFPRQQKTAIVPGGDMLTGRVILHVFGTFGMRVYIFTQGSLKNKFTET